MAAQTPALNVAVSVLHHGPMILEIRVETSREATPDDRGRHLGKVLLARLQSWWSLHEPVHWPADARITTTANVPSWRRLFRPKQQHSPLLAFLLS